MLLPTRRAGAAPALPPLPGFGKAGAGGKGALVFQLTPYLLKHFPFALTTIFNLWGLI